MEITVLHLHDPLPVAVWHLQGELDGSNEQKLIEEVQRENKTGARYLVLDLSFLTCLDEAGLSTLKSATSLFCEGGSNGGSADPREKIHERVRLLHVPEEAERLLKETGSSRLFETCSDLRQALKSFLL